MSQQQQQEQQDQESSPNFYKTGRPYVSGRCLEGAQQVSGRYQDCVWCLEVLRVSGRGLEGIWRVPGRCLESVWKMSGGILDGV